MKYITGLYALNLHYGQETDGDWHKSCYDFSKPRMATTEGHPLGNWGLYKIHLKEYADNEVYVATHLRAILDILYFGTEGEIRGIRGFKKDFIVTDKYDNEFMDKALMLINKGVRNADLIKIYVGYEYGKAWFKRMREKELV